MLQRQHAQVRGSSKEWPVHDRGNLLPVLVPPADCIQDPGFRKMLQRQHAQVRGFSDEYSAHYHDTLLPVLVRPAACV